MVSRGRDVEENRQLFLEELEAREAGINNGLDGLPRICPDVHRGAERFWYGGYDDGVGIARAADAAAGLPVHLQWQSVPYVPTEQMLDAARDWSAAKYGKPIGNDAAIGCWQAMFAAASGDEPPETAGQ